MEKRKRPRVDFSIDAVFETGENIRTDHQCEDISMSGVFLRTSEPFPVGSVGNLLLVLECGDERVEVRAQCRVTRVVVGESDKPSGMGLEFVSLDSDSSIALFNVVKYQGG
ncbi:MAG: PilZ domain-containing protein [Pseudomonadota bacterium]